MFFISLEEPEMGKWWLSSVYSFTHVCIHSTYLDGLIEVTAVAVCNVVPGSQLNGWGVEVV